MVASFPEEMVHLVDESFFFSQKNVVGGIQRKMLTKVAIDFRQIFNLSLEKGAGLKITQIEHTRTDFIF